MSNTNDELSDAIAEKLDKLLYEIIENNDNGVVSEKLIKKIKVHFPGIQNKTSDKMIKFLSRLGDNEKLLKSLCGIDKLPIFYDYENTADTQMRTVYEYISSNITRTIMYANNPKYNEAIVKFNEESHSDIFFEGALTYMFMKDCTNIYDYIEKYLYKASTTDIIYNVINHICFIDNGTNYLLFYRVRDKNPVNERIISSERELNDKLDIRLVKLLTLNTKPPVRIPGRNMTNNTLIPRRVYSARLGWLINPNDKESLKYFREYFYNKCHEKGVIDYELDALNKCDNEDWDNILVNLMKYNSKEKYNSWYVKGFIMSLETANEGLLKEIASVISVFKSDPLGMIEDIKEKYEELKAKNCGGQNE